jgi:probable F420-dependent oxidoreductase
MARRRPLRFSIQVPQAPDMAAWKDIARRAEDAGFYSLSIPDHLGPSLPQLAPLVALAAAAAVTSRLRLVTTVLDNDFRHPVMLAKEVATLDLLSEGRFDLGMGAGWLEEDYTKTGVAPWEAPEVRVSRLIESIAVLRRLFSGETVTFDGRFYHLRDYLSYPKPVQDPIPLMIGGRGKRMLKMAAREAQIISILAATSEGGNKLAGFEQQLAWIAEAGADAREDLMLGVRVLPFGEISETTARRTLAERLGADRGLSADEVLASPFFAVGDPSSVRDHFLEISERYGITYFTVSDASAWKLAPIIGELSA